MRKVLYLLIIPVLLMGCAKVKEAEVPQEQEGLHEVVFHAGWDPETRTELQEDGSIWWTPGDEIVLIDESLHRYKFTSTNTKPAAKADFIGNLPEELLSQPLYAQYPYNEYGICSDDYFTIEIPDVQYATETITKGQFISVATAINDNLYFYGAVSGIKLRVVHEDIDKIVISTGGMGNSPLAGKVGGWLKDGIPEGCWEPNPGESKRSITVYPADGGHFIPGKTYYVILSIGSHDLNISYYRGGTCATKVMDYTTFKRSTFKRCYDQDKDLIFTQAFDSFALLPNEFLPEGIQGKDITEVHFHTFSDVTTDYVLENDPYLDYRPIYFELVGNVAHYYTSAACYKLGNASGLFRGWRKLKSLDLSMFNTEFCNSTASMFEGCINLESVDLSSFNTPNLQSMQAMFQNCKRLQTIDLSSFNFMSLFNDELHIAPCEALFNRCYSLTKVDLGKLDINEGQCSHAMLDIAKFSKNCAIRCLSTTKEALSSAEARLNNNAQYITWFLPDEELPDFMPVVDPALYKSSDYHKDKTVRILNEASKGNGIDIVLMGDGYSDRMIADGTYDTDMELAMDAIFSKEPYASFRDYFNVYTVYAVSESELIYDSPTVFDSSLSEDYEHGFYSFYDQDLVVDYASSACDNLSEAGIVIILNQLNVNSKPLGVANVFIYPDKTDISNYGSGGSIALVNRDDRSETETFSYTVSHEFGHVFAKLGDEYWIYGDAISDWERNYLIEQSSNWGYWKNLDFSSDPASVKWNKFLVDERYADTGLGVYEGGQGYAWGVFHPSINNIMNNITDNTSRFNAPSREAIYYRIHKLAFGPDWNYDFEEFVTYDEKNLQADKASAFQTSAPIVTQHRNHVFRIDNVTAPDGKEKIKIMMD